MRLFELEKQSGLPTKAGAAVLNWIAQDNDQQTPNRVGGEILLPKDPSVEFFPLQEGRQFVLETDNKVYFGGTDESPFLVELKGDTAMSYLCNEEKFYESLRPPRLAELEKYFGTKAIRQGDWFALPIPVPFIHIAACLGLGGLTFKGAENRKEPEKITLGGTRHSLLSSTFLLCSANNFGCHLVGEGILSAPDHADRTLEGPHAFFQANNLALPQYAD